MNDEKKSNELASTLMQLLRDGNIERACSRLNECRRVQEEGKAARFAKKATEVFGTRILEDLAGGLAGNKASLALLPTPIYKSGTYKVDGISYPGFLVAQIVYLNDEGHQEQRAKALQEFAKFDRWAHGKPMFYAKSEEIGNTRYSLCSIYLDALEIKDAIREDMVLPNLF